MEIPQIGTLISAKGRTFTIRLLSDNEGFQPVISNGENSMLTGQIGTHVSIQQTGVHVIAIVLSNWQEEANGLMSRYIECNPIGELLNEDVFSQISPVDPYLFDDLRDRFPFSHNFEDGVASWVGIWCVAPQLSVQMNLNLFHIS